ncbi:cilia- and flagella-associated protein 410 isoform X2 [Contarinia nasturtii]|uniref:cilia- and flagella-associated protein 410 isoform X2 n=1 Tax=Contarinia nasturtii TaxID=265458 RepID=UPI0012D478EB|nr:cilia- and flagella-associated protein 410 isoform X2 [Contarinia nasturtii]
MTRLTEEMVIARSRQSDLASIKKLNCWGSELSDVSIIRRMRGVEVLALSVNKISSLSDFEDCHKLQELYLRKNNIKDINDLVYLQGLPHLKKLWLEENPCVEMAGPNYRQIVLRALPNLEMLDNVGVTSEELADAMKGGHAVQSQEEVYEDAYSNGPTQQQAPQQQQQQQYRQQSPVREKSPPNQEYSPAEPNHPPSPKQRDYRSSYHQQSYDRSPGSDEIQNTSGYRERPHIVPSMSTHSMKEYYQSDRPMPAHYRHSQSDLTEWDEPNHSTPQQRRSGGPNVERDANYPYRNGSREKEEWDENERGRPRRQDGRFSDTASVVSNAVLNHYASYHRRPVNRSSNLLSATLCLVKELDYPSLEVVEHAVRCRIDELAAE